MNDTLTLAKARYQAALPATPAGLAEVSRRHHSLPALRGTRHETEAEIAKPLAEHTAANGLFRLLGTLATHWRTWRGSRAIRAEIDDLSDGQVRDLGVCRVARRARWLDGADTRLPMDYFYRIHPDV
ncbi:hypothetical protein [Sinorhizobium terangae]|uniref:hypothetical protein n=1 Tax=Sinorhizobium terangae TaxID=110322 RepID=UPI001610C2D9|nr:hypothetical protein [Sinorhizobium terangae]MBB4189654.1 uncharacterized protein YjiS (DUF1127 family) [Sinorhizobium terangae]WFU49534.1 hypothetical protein QA637_09125 [Sinorhizobium terangae]